MDDQYASARTLLRVRGDERLIERLASPGQIRISTRESLAAGDRVAVEVSFGALADEVVVMGEVISCIDDPNRHGTGRREVDVAVDERDLDRLSYVRAVAGGRRDASARSHRRVPIDLPVVWERDESTNESRLVDISRGGAFIASNEPPRVGERLEVVLPAVNDDAPGPIRVRSIVTWISRDAARAGFGVEFRIADRGQAASLANLVRRSELAG